MSVSDDRLGPLRAGCSYVPDLNAAIEATGKNDITLVVVGARRYTRLDTSFVLQFEHILMWQVGLHTVALRLNVPLAHGAIKTTRQEQVGVLRMELTIGYARHMTLGVGQVLNVHVAAHSCQELGAVAF